MTIQYQEALRTAQAAVIETHIGTAPDLEVWTGAAPANCAASDSGTKIASGTLPSDWLDAAATGAVAKTGTWTLTGLTAASTGTAGGHFRIRKSGTVYIQGTFGVGADMAPDNNSIADGQTVTISTFTLTRGNA